MLKELISDFLDSYGDTDVNSWNDKAFKNASDSVFEKTGIRISVNTLKRLFGKIKTEKTYSPQSASLNALAKYLGYQSFYEYKIQHASVNKIIIRLNQKRKHISLIIGILLSLVILIIISFQFSDSQHNGISTEGGSTVVDKELVLKVNPLSSKTAVNADFVYDVPKEILEDNSGKFVLNGKSYPLQKSRTIISETYSTPGIYRGRIIIDDSLYKSQSVSILSDGWIFLNGSTEFNDTNRINNKNLKVEAKIIKDFYIPDDDFLFELAYDTITIPENRANNLKIKLKLVFDHEDIFLVFYGDDILNKNPLNTIAGQPNFEQGNNQIIKKNGPLDIKVKGNKHNFLIDINGTTISKYKKNISYGDLRMIVYESRREKITLNRFQVSTSDKGLTYDLLNLEN